MSNSSNMKDILMGISSDEMKRLEEAMRSRGGFPVIPPPKYDEIKAFIRTRPWGKYALRGKA